MRAQPLIPGGLVALALTFAVALAACGEKDEPEVAAPPTEESSSAATTTTTQQGGGEKLSTQDQIEQTVVTVVGGADPTATCSELSTPGYVKQAYGNEQGCRAAVAAHKPFEVAVSAIEIEGARATANAKPSGGPNRGEKLEVRLLEDGPTWLVSYVRSNAPAGP